MCVLYINLYSVENMSKYVPQFPYRKQSVFVAPQGLNSIVNVDSHSPPLQLLHHSNHNSHTNHSNHTIHTNHTTIPHSHSVSHSTITLTSPTIPRTPIPSICSISPPHTSSSVRKSSAFALPKANVQILDQRINKIISENAAIVETWDPLWSKKYIRDSRNVSTPSMSMSMTQHVSHQNGMTSPVSGEMVITHETRRYSEQPLSKLQSALLGKSSTSAASVTASVSLTTPSAILPNNRKYSDSMSESSPQTQSVIINAKNDRNGERIDSIVRNLLTAKTPAIHVTPSEKTIPVTSCTVGAHPQNPEGSIIKDLLLKSRDENRRTKSSRTDATQRSTAGEQESSMLVYVCTVCNIAFRNKENLEVHQIHYCKGNNDLVSPDKTLRHKMDEYVQRKVSVMARPMQKHYRHQTFAHHMHHQKHVQSHSHPQLSHQSHQHQQQQQQSQQQQQQQQQPLTPVGNILKQQLLAPNQGSPLKKRKISEPVFRSSCDSADIQIIDETPVRRISVVQQTQTTVTSTMISPSTTLSTTKSALPSQQMSHFHQSLHHSYPPYPSYSSVSSSHIVIQPVLNSGGTVIETLSQSKCSNEMHISVDNTNTNNNRNMQITALTASPQPVNIKCGSNLVNIGIEIIPAYLPHINKPKTKITLKTPIMFPILESLYANGNNTDFTVDDCGSYKLCESFERRPSKPFKQVASVPQPFNEDNNNSNNTDNNNSNNNGMNNEDDDEIQVVSQKTGIEREPEITKLFQRTTGAIRPRTLSLRANASTLISSTLISPDTPRPKKSHVQQYINGHAYTFIGLKVTTRPTYCCIYRAQPMFITQKENPGLSMYSNWKAIPLPPNDILHLAPPKKILGLYDSRSRYRTDSMVNTCSTKCDLNLTHSSYWQFRKSDEEKDNLRDAMNLREDIGEINGYVFRKTSEESTISGETDSDGGEVGPPKRVRIFEGGFKSNEDYTYVRGRGRGKYVCEECGIRCKKPSMLKKHIRTHTDLRPYSCRHCAFAFKTKGNLTKHMKSKAHHKKCVEMGIIPVPITIDDSQIDTDALAKQEMLEISCGGLPEDDDDDDDEGEYDEDDDEDDDEGVPIPLIELRRYEAVANHVNAVPGQFEDAEFSADDRIRNISETESIATESEEQEAARSLLILSGSGSESDLTALSSNTRKSSALSSNIDDIRHSPVEVISRKVSVIDRRIDGEQHRRISQQHLDHSNHSNHSNIVKVTDVSEIIAPNVAPMHPPLDNVTLAPPPPPLMSSPRKLSPIEHLQQHVQEQQKQLMQTTWTPNCDSLSRQRSYSFNDLPINANVFPSTSRPIPELPETITDESSDDSLDSFASRRYSTSIITERRWNSATNAPLIRTVITEREEPMDLSLNPKGNELMDIIPHLNRMKSNSMRLSGLRAGEFIPTAPQRVPTDSLDGKSICSICNKQCSKPSLLRLHMNIHYFERPFRCESCGVSFRTKGHLQKHKRSVSHFNKVNMNMTFGTPTTDNPRPFKCNDCKIAFRIHGHLAKHLRSKMHIMKLECLGKLPFGMYAEMERSGVNLNEIDTTDCENSLQSLQLMAQRLYDPRQMRWASEPMVDNNGDDNNGVIVKSEPQDAYYPLEYEQHSILMEQIETPSPQMRSPSHQSVISSPAQCMELPLSPQSQPQSRKSPVMAAPISAQQHQHQPQSTGFTSTRSNTCHLCGRIFKDAKFLQVHLYGDHKLESEASQLDDTPEYECDICHKFFSELSHLQQHLVSHTVSRPYVCEICDAGFTSSLLLATHISTHHPLTTQPIA